MSILCHIWKIVPDLYEAITKIQGSETIRNTTVAFFYGNETNGNCSRQKRMMEEEVKSNILINLQGLLKWFETTNLHITFIKGHSSGVWGCLVSKEGLVLGSVTLGPRVSEEI